MKQNSKNAAAKAKILATLMTLLSAIPGFAKEHNAVVLNTADVPQGSGRTSTRILCDTNGDRRTDMIITLSNIEIFLIPFLLKTYLTPGTHFTYDDKYARHDRGIEMNPYETILSIEGDDILDIFPGENKTFRLADAKRAAQKGKGR